MQYLCDHLNQFHRHKWLLNKGPAVIENQQISIRSPRHQHHAQVGSGLLQRLAQVRDLTAPPAEYSKSDPGEDAPPLSAPTGQSLLETVRELVGMAQEQAVKASL